MAPMVGTNATRWPLRRHPETARRTATIAPLMITPPPGERTPSIRLLLGGKPTRLHVRDVAVECFAHRLGQARVPSHELRLVAEEESEQVVGHQHLAVAADAGADPDGRNAERAA